MCVGQGKVFARASGKLQLSERSTSSLKSNVLVDILYVQREKGPVNFFCSCKDILCKREIMRENNKCYQQRSFLHFLTLNSHLKALIKLLIKQNEEKHIWTELRTPLDVVILVLRCIINLVHSIPEFLMQVNTFFDN